MDLPARSIITGTPIPNREREAAAEAPGDLVVHKMDPAQIETYLQERYGNRLNKPGKTPVIPGRPVTDDKITALEEQPQTAKTDKEPQPEESRKQTSTITREQYLALRLQGKSRSQALKALFKYLGNGYAMLEQWGLRDLQTEQMEMTRLQGESVTPEATSEPEPTITVPVPVNSDMIRAVLHALIRDVHATAVAKGWHEAIVPLPVHLALIHSEVSEALQADRKGEGDEAVAEELADVVIRVMDTAAAHGLDLAGAMLAKMERNKGRPYRHEGKKY